MSNQIEDLYMNDTFSKICQIAENKAKFERLENQRKDLIIESKWKWFEQNKNKILFIQETFKVMLDKDIKLHCFKYREKAPTECIYLFKETNRIGVRIGDIYKRTASFGLNTLDQSIYIESLEDLSFENICVLLDKLREGIEQFPEHIEKYLKALIEKSEERLNRVKTELEQIRNS